MWHYNGSEFTSEMIDEHVGFVYMVTDKRNNKKYIGKKLFFSTRMLKPLKGKKKRRTKITESDWQTYYGSSEEVKQLVEENGGEIFYREILHLCKSKGEMSLFEALEQLDRDVLFDDNYYNGIVNIRLNQAAVKGLHEKVCNWRNANASSRSQPPPSHSEDT